MTFKDLSVEEASLEWHTAREDLCASYLHGIEEGRAEKLTRLGFAETNLRNAVIKHLGV